MMLLIGAANGIGRRGWLATLLGLLIVMQPGCFERVLADETEPVERPAFPQPIGIGMKTYRIISEVVEEHDTISRTNEEYVDLNLGKASFVANSRTGNSVRHVDAEEGVSFTYSPYKCLVDDMSLVGSGQVGSLDGFSADFIVNLPDDIGDELGDSMEAAGGKYADRLPKATRPRPLRLFGISGLWLLAAGRPKSFKKANLVYSATTDAYKPAFVWHFDESGLGVDMIFSKGAGAAEPTLETIRISSNKEKTVLRTINILAIESSIPAEAYDDILSIPLGYGCFSSLTDERTDQMGQELGGDGGSSKPELAKIRRAYANRHVVDSGAVWLGRAELEVTATVNKAGVRWSDTFTVELAQTNIASGEGQRTSEPRVKLIRKRSSREDTKVVLNRVFKMKYKIDMLRGKCEMSHYSTFEATREQVLLDFANGAKFDANMELFKESDDLHFIKVTSGESNKRRLHHYEGTAASSELISWIRTSTGVTEDVARRTRVVRSYALGESSLELVSVTIWLLDDSQTQIVESYQIYVVEMQDELGGGGGGARQLAEDRARMFDISYECYLENDDMLENRDFAWFQLTYPVSQRVLRLVADEAHVIKQLYYEHFINDITRMPRVELVFEEDQFKLRTLLLDLPPVELAYDKMSQVKLVPTMEKHDQINMEPDLRHCASLCRQQHCTVMTYCKSSKYCTLSKRTLYDFSSGQSQDNNDTTSRTYAELRDELGFSPEKDCDTYKITAQLEHQQSFKTTNLATVLARIQHNSYNLQVDLPEPPEEATLDESESGLSSAERLKATLDYEEKVYALLAQDNRLPELAFPVRLSGRFFFLLPSKFELERDPLDEFHLTRGNELEEDADSPLGGYDDEKVPHFHKGLNEARLNPIGNQQNQQNQQVALHSFRGLTYDQCAMACWDGKCGIFSFCESGGECILANAKTIGHARVLGLIVQAHDCLVAQRDFLGQFNRFANVYKPQVYKRRTNDPTTDPSACALDCVAETDFRCLSFQYCSNGDAGGGGSQCYFQEARHSANEVAPTETGCDHYARSQVADYIRLDARRLTEDIAGKLKTSSYNDLTVFDCAEKCSNELIDCTAFQFCHQTQARFRECLTIESKVTRAMLRASNKSDEQTIVDESIDDGQIVHASNFLTYDTDCQVFSMRRDSSQAHLRDLALGGLITIAANPDGSKPLQRMAAGSAGGGLWRAFLLFVSVTAITTFATCGVILLTRHNQFVRSQLARFQLVNY